MYQCYKFLCWNLTARTDREIHTLLEMDNGTPEANNVRERWQYIELEAFF